MPLPSPAMRRPRDNNMIPKPVLRMMLLLVVSTLVIVSGAVFLGRAPTGQPKDSPVVAQRDLILRTGGAQAVTLYDVDGTLISALPHGGFVTVIASGIDRARTVHQVTGDAPVSITRHANGRLVVTDPATGWSAELNAFGSDNEAAFAALLPQE